MAILDTTIETYHPGEAWAPSNIPEDLAELAESFHFYEADWERDYLLARALSRTVDTILTGDDPKKPGISRAVNAINLEGGNCIAHTEIGTGFANALDLEVFPLIGRDQGYSWHASSLWLGKTAVWEIDYYFQEHHELARYSEARVKIQDAARSGLESQQGIHLNYDHMDDYFEVAPASIDGQLEANPFAGRKDVKFTNRLITALPYEAGLHMLKAFADYQRYLQLKPERIARIGDQVLSFVPHGIS